MLQNHIFASAFAHTTTPHLLVLCDSNPTIVSANNALCTWLECTPGELLNIELSKSFKLLEALGTSGHHMSQLTVQVVATRAAVKKSIEGNLQAMENTSTESASGFYEIFPIGEESDSKYVAIQVVILNKASSLATPVATSSNTAPNQPLELLIDSLSNVIFTLEVESPEFYKFSFANRAFQVTTGLPVEKVVGKYVHEIIPEPSLTMVLEKYKEAIERKQQVSWEEVSHYPAGQKTGEVLVVPVFDAKGNCFRLVGLVHDVTPFKEAEAKQKRMTQDLYQQNRDLQQFTYILSHNLRAPLANALGLVRHLPELVPGTEIFRKCLSYLNTSIENLDKILQDLNMILSVRDRQNPILLEPVSVGEVCMQAAQTLEDELSQTGGSLKISIDPNFTVQANRAYIYSICYNLLINAIKYRSHERPLCINVTSNSTAKDGPTLHFTDNGYGIDIDKASHDLFKLYKRFHSHVAGRGIGLFLVKTHLEALGGRIEVKSKLNEGTTFSVFFKEFLR